MARKPNTVRDTETASDGTKTRGPTSEPARGRGKHGVGLTAPEAAPAQPGQRARAARAKPASLPGADTAAPAGNAGQHQFLAGSEAPRIGEPTEQRSHDTLSTQATSEPALAAKPAARWDRAADTVTFDWAAIERTAAQEGANQVMAKLLIAARAEGANSRWPL